MINCPICNFNFQGSDYSEKYISIFDGQEYKRYQCLNCKVYFWFPLKMMTKFYENDIFGLYKASHCGQSSLEARHKSFLEHFPPNIKGRLLDIGCADGAFLKLAQELSFEIYGIDFDQKSIKYAKERLKTETIYAMSLREFYCFAEKENLRFDVITFFDVLEHQDQPKEFLLMVRDLLESGGYIFGSIPNREGLFKKTEWKSHGGDYPPHHFLRFSKIALQNALKLTGFTDIKIFKTSFPKELLSYYLYLEIRFHIDSLKLWLSGKKNRLAHSRVTLNVLPHETVSNMKFIKILRKIKRVFNSIIYALYLPVLKNGQYLCFRARVL